MWMIQRREHAGLALQARAPFRVGSKRGRQHFNGHVASKRLVVCAVHFAHAADSDSFANSVSSEARARERAVRGTQDTRFRQRDRWSAHKSFGMWLVCEERLHFAPQRVIAAAGLDQKRGALALGAGERRIAEIVDPTPAITVHRAHRLRARATTTILQPASRV